MQQWFATKASLLRCVGRFAQRVFYSQMYTIYYGIQEFLDGQQLAADIGSEWQLSSSVLAQLSPATLQSLRLYWVAVDAAAAAEMERLTSLTQLQINYRGELPSCVLAALPSFLHLLSLELCCSSIPESLPAALQRPTRLTSLTCESKSPLPELSAVMPLTRLRQLEWKQELRGAPLQVGAQQLLARLPQLESWHLWMKMKILQVHDFYRGSWHALSILVKVDYWQAGDGHGCVPAPRLQCVCGRRNAAVAKHGPVQSGARTVLPFANACNEPAPALPILFSGWQLYADRLLCCRLQPGRWHGASADGFGPAKHAQPASAGGCSTAGWHTAQPAAQP